LLQNVSAGGRIGVWQTPSTIVLVVVLVLDYERGLGLASTEIHPELESKVPQTRWANVFEDEDDDEDD
jgi:hypothetical protein